MTKNTKRPSRARLRSLDRAQLAEVHGGVWTKPSIIDGCIRPLPYPDPYPLPMPSPYPIPIW